MTALFITLALMRPGGRGSTFSHIRYSRSATWTDLLREAQSVVRVRVESIDGPFWNSSNGEFWRGADDVPSLQMSRVHMVAEEIWYGESVENPLELYVLGDAHKRYEGSAIPESDSISGGFIEGEPFIVLIKRATYQFETGAREVWTLGSEFEGNWRVEGGDAVGSDTSRSAGLTQLRALIGAAWDTSRVAPQPGLTSTP